MTRGMKWKIFLIIVVFVIAVWQLYPSIRLSQLSESERESMDKDKILKLEKKSFHLGLDLQGGMYLVLEVDRTKLKETEVKDARDRALEIIRNRIDQFGVYEPSIQPQGKDRIVIQLPGVDRERAKSLIGRTAQLEFKLVAEDKEIKRVFDKIDSFIYEQEKTVKDTFEVVSAPFYSSLIRVRGGDIGVAEEKLSKVKEMLKLVEEEKIIPDDMEIRWGSKEEGKGYVYQPLFLLKKEAELTGGAIADARVDIGAEATRPNASYVSLTMTRNARKKFAAVTGANVDRRLAIVLDGVVKSAPVIREKIRGGRSQITGDFTIEEAKDLAIILKAGALPAPVNIIEERNVGPSLGADSINKGIRAIIWGGIAVLVFMLIYYSFSGSIADLALVLNLVLLLAFLSGIRATLTLPGLAGILLTVGLAVDANVLIFERIREELRVGKTVRAAIDAGYARAFRTILDANLTTLLAAIILYWFGTGPVRGFAITLSIGICASFFTAIVMTRVVFDLITLKFKPKRLRI